ncbi:DUF1254 domain-containing protein [Caballeronia sp. M1242]|uniref:DUF1254 domain-containing protein n=1 Tax=Caballeronia sp. M1242 TaxID=2814653 RepID=UPI0019D147C7|nr:DUF1254 domain-containing protein [Caballeronia sp. M1242]QSN62147.1 DUF1254 domain-containing protein [Caballeronia sp. M1242]
MSARSRIFAAAFYFAFLTLGRAEETPKPVTADNFNRAESDLYFRQAVSRAKGLGAFDHRRVPASADSQVVVRTNRDTLYSAAVFDLDAGPVTVTMPDAGKRFMSLMAIDEDHYVAGVHYGAGRYTFDRQRVGTRYVLLGVRVFVDPNSPDDLAKAHALQDAIRTEQASPGRFEVPAWDTVSQKKVRDALLALATTLPDTHRMFGSRGEVDPVRHLIASASGWGGNPDRDATYLTVTPPGNDGTKVFRLTVKDVPVDAFWSITMYNAQGRLEKNAYDAYSVNDVTAKKNVDGSVTVQFGGCDGVIPNCLPTPPDWTYWVRLYRPRAEILSGAWRFPDAQPVQ